MSSKYLLKERDFFKKIRYSLQREKFDLVFKLIQETREKLENISFADNLQSMKEKLDEIQMRALAKKIKNLIIRAQYASKSETHDNLVAKANDSYQNFLQFTQDHLAVSEKLKQENKNLFRSPQDIYQDYIN